MKALAVNDTKVYKLYRWPKGNRQSSEIPSSTDFSRTVGTTALKSYRYDSPTKYIKYTNYVQRGSEILNMLVSSEK